MAGNKKEDLHPYGLQILFLSRVYLKNSLRLHHGVFSAISASENLGQSRTISRKG